MRKNIIVLWFLFVSVSLILWWQWPSMVPEVIVCDVGQGDGMIVTQGFSQLVIDTGRANGAMIDCMGQVLPFWDRRIEMVVVTHADSDHAGGLVEMAKMYQLGKVVTSEYSAKTILGQISDATNMQMGLVGQRWDWGNVGIEIMWPPRLGTLPKKIADSSNDSGLVLRLEFQGGDSIWLAADVGEAVEKILIDRGNVRPTTVLKVSHHGSKHATTEPFLSILQPRLFLISVGKNNYGHPASSLLELINKLGGVVVRTDEMGIIRWVPGR